MTIRKLDASLQTLFAGTRNSPTPIKGRWREPVLIFPDLGPNGTDDAVTKLNAIPNNLLHDKEVFATQGKMIAFVQRRRLLALAGNANVAYVRSLAAAMRPRRAAVPSAKARPVTLETVADVPSKAAWALTGSRTTANDPLEITGFAPNSVTGKGVVIGVIDTTMDVANPMFAKRGSKCLESRFRYLWVQGNRGSAASHPPVTALTKVGQHPGGTAGTFASYGEEFDQTKINDHTQNYSGLAGNARVTVATNNHGTQTSACAAGIGFDGPDWRHPHLGIVNHGAVMSEEKDAGRELQAAEFSGVAPEASLIGVGYTMSKGYIGWLHALRYIVNRARENDPPAGPKTPVVINMSLGYEAGPRSAEDPISTFFDAVIAEEFPTGVQIVKAAGNEQQFGMHSLITMPANETQLEVGLTFADAAHTTVTTQKARKEHSMRVFLYVQITQDMLDDPDAMTVELPRPAANSWHRKVQITQHMPFANIITSGAKLRGGVGTGNPFAPKTAPAVGDWRCFVVRYRIPKATAKVNGTTKIRVTAPNNTQIRMFTESKGGFRLTAVAAPPKVTRVADSQICEIGACENILTVGAVDADPANSPDLVTAARTGARIANFSSTGPLLKYTPTGRQPAKPNLVASGVDIQMPVPMNLGGRHSLDIALNFNRRVIMRPASGTSYATPLVTGLVALMLQIKPDLTPQQIITILSTAANNITPTNSNGTPVATGAAFAKAYGAGVMDVQKALTAVRALVPNP